MKLSQFARFCAPLLTLTLSAQAAVWRVDSIPGHPADFTDLNTAINSAQVQEGDTLVLQGNFTGQTTLNRKLHLVGYGYFHAENGYDYPIGTTLEARLSTLVIEPGATTRADGASLTGCVVTGQITINDAANILIRRNKIANLVLEGTGDQAARGITIAQNYFLGFTSNFAVTIRSSGSRSNGDVLIVGNYIPGLGNPGAGGSSISFGPDDSATVVNNVVDRVTLSGYGAFQNNIMRSGAGFSTWITVKNNISTTGYALPVGNGNLNSVDIADVFELTGSTDGQFKLKAGRPAIGGGADGYDIGMFSGPMPYILSGLPPVPIITQLEVPPVVQDGADVPVTIRAEVKQ
jgi:hypothetical protein